MNNTKQCSKCKRILPLDNFRWKNKANGLKHSQCKQCQSKQEKIRYQQDKTRKQAILDRTFSYKERNLEFIKQQKSCGCQKCGEKRFYVLEKYRKMKIGNLNQYVILMMLAYRLEHGIPYLCFLDIVDFQIRSS